MRNIWIIMIVCAAALTPFTAGAMTAKKQEPVSRLKPWQDFANRQNMSLNALSACEQGNCESAEVQRWAGLITDLKMQNRLRQIITVNKWFNRLPYKHDQFAYGQLDYWADTRQLLINRGDCEDYALSKYYTLRQLGFTPEELKIMVVYDQSTYTNHAVLMVYTNGSRYMMDINSDDTDPSPMESRYRSIYGFNEKTAWYY